MSADEAQPRDFSKSESRFSSADTEDILGILHVRDRVRGGDSGARGITVMCCGQGGEWSREV